MRPKNASRGRSTCSSCNSAGSSTSAAGTGDRNGAFYPFVERAAQWTDHPPEALLHHIERDLLAHTGGHLGDDVALLAIHRAPIPHRSGR
ncbi:hypothetical protein ACFU93_42025 [Streptomyces sp. NPDC057611]|uniref:hypothetical protein n=1 Tax=Streptomyces sp. NPDC057611 TaxID=3346182 RepID=UPI0036861634